MELYLSIDKPNTELTLKKNRNIFQLRHIIFSVSTVLGQQGKVFQILTTSMGGIEFTEFPKYHPPCFNFFSCVLHSGNGLTTVKNKIMQNTSEYNQILDRLRMAKFL